MAERRKIYRELKKQKQGIIPPPIHNLTLNKYFRIIKEAILALCDDKGIYHDGWNGEKIAFKTKSPHKVAKRVMDGRSLFHSPYHDPCGILDSINPNSPTQFKWWVTNAQYGGHPWESWFGNIVPVPIYKKGYSWKNKPISDKTIKPEDYHTDDWLLWIPTGHRCSPRAFRCLLRLRELGFPIIWEQDKEKDKWLLSKRYFVDLSEGINWWDIDESFFYKNKKG